MLELWQANAAGRYDHLEDLQEEGRQERPIDPNFHGFGRTATGPDGRFRLRTIKPGPLPAPDGGVEAPHIDVTVLARGLLARLVTRIYFADEPAANESDPVLSALPETADARTLIAVAQDAGYRFDIHLQGDGETVFFAV